MDALREARDYPQAEYLRGAATAAKEVDVKPLMESGLTGQALGVALKTERLSALRAYKVR